MTTPQTPSAPPSTPPRLEILPGNPAPMFTGRTPTRPRFTLDVMGGRYLVLTFFVSAGAAPGRGFLAAMERLRDRFDDVERSWFGVSIDPEDEAGGRLVQSRGVRHFCDFDRRISTLYGLVDEGGEGRPTTYEPTIFVLDPGLRVIARLPIGDPKESVARLADLLNRLPPLPPAFQAPPHAPVMIVPYVFGPDLCRRLIARYDEHGGRESGYMRDEDGLTVGVMNRHMKRRSDHYIEDEALRGEIRDAFRARLIPAMVKGFQTDAKVVERYLIACYDGADQGCFLAHRDNVSLGTAHRQFAVSINLNGDFGGGDLTFPEFGRATYKAPPGAAVIFACSLLHEARPVTSGRRLVFLTFLYDQQRAELRGRNARFLSGDAPIGERRAIVGA